ncbi:thiamine pyrophosphate-binding protein [Spongiactinospora sp. TRM90649]|uniref:thiamine pyrophosphate-binding protein n=1 Tax=Spongiactinospora sp. TRM90649 TaxID=3031114 RepID=UPI0023F8D67A|nr:thiamine pyrophosphate-binding protein [Spongiactinospora sp. TRM90649]MDF5752068.1 thiamine pyrophosphate-binding protein [Spongiactinospora sp. TRM90649]
MASPRTGTAALLEQLRADGMTTVFGNPGTVEQGLLDALDAAEGFRYVLGLAEAPVVGMADGYARATRKPTFVQLHSGVGLGNGIGMLYQAMRGHAPLVVVAGEAGVRYDAFDAQMAADLVGMARPVTKFATRVIDPGSVLRVFRRAVKIATTPPCGPVFVSLPLDILDAPNDEIVVPTTIPQTRTVPVPELIDAAAGLLAGAERPVILAGDGVAESDAQPELARIAELLGARVWLADTSVVNLDAAHPLHRGPLGHMFGEVSAAAVREADAVLIVGTYVFPEVFPLIGSPFAKGAKVVHIDLNAYEIGKNHPVDLGLVADPRATLTALGAELVRRGVTPAVVPPAAAPAATTGGEVYERFLAELAAQTPDPVIFDEALTSGPALVRHFPPRSPGRYYLTRGGSLGVGIPGAVGIKLAMPDDVVIGFTGDGGSMYTIQALWTAAHQGIGAKFVVCNNGKYELLNDNISVYWRERGVAPHRFPSSFDLSGLPIGFSDIARGLGVPAARVASPDDVGPAVKRMLADDEPFLVDVLVEPGR